MKKLILGLLLIFSFSYGFDDDRIYNFSSNKYVIFKTQQIAMDLYYITPEFTAEVMKHIFVPYEKDYGITSLLRLGHCLTNLYTNKIKNVDECNILTDLNAMWDFIGELDKNDQKTSIRVIQSFYVAWELISKEMKQDESNKKRI